MTDLFEQVTNTARWVAVYRAQESKRQNALFRDPYASLLAGERGEAIVRTLPRLPGRSNGGSLVIRTAVFDELILRAIQRDGVDAVLNLGCGLDTRPYRLPLPSTLRWIEVDLPEMLEYKKQQLADVMPACIVESVPCDLADAVGRQALLQQVGSKVNKVLVVTEGLLAYLTPNQVAALATELHSQFSFQWWLLDVVSPILLQWFEKLWGSKLKGARMLLQFAPTEGPAFFKPYGWKVIECRSSTDEARRLKRDLTLASILRLLSIFVPHERKTQYRNLTSFAILERE